ncbi:MAG: phage head closure protein [Tepidisphaeraceae bacterium]
MAIAAGLLNRRVTLLAPQTRLAGANEAVTTHRAVWTVWANIVQTAATETPADGQMRAPVTYLVTIRYLCDVNESWRIKIDGKEHPISSVIERGRREELAITVHEVR